MKEVHTKVLKLVKRAPKCPECQVPMVRDGEEYSDKQLKIMDVQKNCKHDFSGTFEICTKCQYCLFAMSRQTCPKDTCPKCFNSYKEDEE